MSILNTYTSTPHSYEATMRTLLEAMPDLLIRVTRDGTFLNASAAQAFARELAVEPDAPTLAAILPRPVVEQLLHAISLVLDGEEVQIRTYNVVVEELLRVYEARIVASGDNEALLIVRDITARQHAEDVQARDRAFLSQRVEERTAELSAANAALARAARLKDDFLASMSHELRTPLNAILGLSEALQEEVYGPVCEPQTRALKSIEESGRHLLSLINDILELSKIEAGKLELQFDNVDLGAVCQSSLRLVEQAARKKQLRVVTSIDGRATEVRADQRRLKQMLVNLLSNAVKFTPEAGTIGLEVTTDVDKGAIDCTVWDTGIGIAENDMRNLFQPFVQLDSSLSRQFAGTGLGLTIVYRMIEMHGGSVSVTSEVGKGSRFTLSLPWSPVSNPAQRERNETSVPALLPVPRRVLLVEDAPTAAEQMTRYLHELGVDVFVTSRGEDVVTRAQELVPDALILDIQLPDAIGWNVLARLKGTAATRHLPVLICSVVDEPERAQQLGASAYLVKPISRQQLQGALLLLMSPPGERQLVVASPQLVKSGTPLLKPTTPATLLLAEDNELNILTMVDYLQASGYRVVVARTGQEAIDQVYAVRPDLILMDIQLPDMDGLQVIHTLRNELSTQGIPIIALTALAMPGDRERCLAVGANGYLSKPVSLQTLITCIEQLRQ